MRRLHVFGSSHVGRILKAVARNKQITDTFLVSGTVKPGAKLTDLIFQVRKLASFNESDILLIQVFGNELIKRNIRIEYKRDRKLFI